jgi:TonB family protein
MGAFYLIAEKAGRYRMRILVGHGGLSYTPYYSLDTAQVIEQKFEVPEYPPAMLEAYLAGDVTKRARLITQRSSIPSYPDELRAQHRAGAVRALVVIGRDGGVDMSTFQLLSSDDYLFTTSVRHAFSRARFEPAELNGTAVPEVFEINVDFGFDNDPPRITARNLITIRATLVGPED